MEWIWQKKPEDEEKEETWATRMEQAERNRRIDPGDKVEKPNVEGIEKEWSIKLLDLDL